MDFNIGDLVELKVNFFNRGLIGIVVGCYNFSGYRWYKIIWNDGVTLSVADTDLKLVEVLDDV